MEPAHLVAFNLTLLAALFSPGPAFVYAVRQSIAGGFAVGVATGTGLALMAAFWTAAALLGLDALFSLFPSAYVAMKLAGAAYLIWIALRIWRAATDPAPAATGPRPNGRAVLSGAAVNLMNPKSVLFAASVLVVIFPPGLGYADKALIVGNHFAVEVVIYTAFAAALSAPPARAGYLRLKPAIDRATALALGAVGLKLLIDR